MKPGRTGVLALWLAAAAAVGSLLVLGLGAPWALRVADEAVADRRAAMGDEMRRAAGELSVRFSEWREQTGSYLERPPAFLVTPVRYEPSPVPMPGPRCRALLREAPPDVDGEDPLLLALDDEALSADERALLTREWVRRGSHADDAVVGERLRRAAAAPDLAPELQLLLDYDLAERNAEQRSALLERLLPATPQDADGYPGVAPGRRAFLAGQLLAADDPRRQGPALRALTFLDQALMADRGGGDPVVGSPDGRWLAWVHEPGAGRYEVIHGPAEEFFARLSPAVARGRFRVDPGDGAAGLAAPLPPWYLRLGPAGEEELAQLQATTQVLRLGMVGALALLLAAVAFQSWRALRRERLLDQDKARFVTTVTHELKTPLATIALCAETLREHGATDPDAIPRFSRMILDETERLGQRIQQILDVAAGRESPGPDAARFDAHGVIEAVVAEARPGAREQGVDIELRLDDGRPELRGSPDHLAQAVNGILENAVQFGGPGTVQVAATVDGGLYVVAIADEGPGLSPEERRQVFEPFVQLQPEMTRTVPGTGLGLTLVRQCARSLGGDVLVKDREPRGSVFLVRVPLAPPEAAR